MYTCGLAEGCLYTCGLAVHGERYMQCLVSPGWSEMPTRTIKGGIAPVPEQDRKDLRVLNGSPRGFIEMVGLARSCVSYTRCHNQEEKCHSTTVDGIIIEPS